MRNADNIAIFLFFFLFLKKQTSHIINTLSIQRLKIKKIVKTCNVQTYTHTYFSCLLLIFLKPRASYSLHYVRHILDVIPARVWANNRNMPRLLRRFVLFLAHFPHGAQDVFKAIVVKFINARILIVYNFIINSLYLVGNLTLF